MSDTSSNESGYSYSSTTLDMQLKSITLTKLFENIFKIRTLHGDVSQITMIRIKMPNDYLVVWSAGDDIPNIQFEIFLENCIIENNQMRQLHNQSPQFPITEGRKYLLNVDTVTTEGSELDIFLKYEPDDTYILMSEVTGEDEEEN
ncbi:hypothetical protein Mgra_00005817 [Meloidogyne graminicola]|uniref:Uncharacterized protein n=1 Tax=Meloidogyne graminicola TaxID=189291 RepID=A0A8S9ZMZ4_9BILA|nr:hypothetical protein Mgra_00005817 [Meloidogyne graminicola]